MSCPKVGIHYCTNYFHLQKVMMHPANEKKNYVAYILLAVMVGLLCWLLLESKQRTKQIDHILKQTVIKNQG